MNPRTILAALVAAASVVALVFQVPDGAPDAVPAPPTSDRLDRSATEPAPEVGPVARAGQVGTKRSPGTGGGPAPVEARRLTVQEGAAEMSAYLERASAVGDLAPMAAMVSGDAAVAEPLAARAEALRTSSDPLLRARGILLLLGLGRLRLEDWIDVLEQEPDPTGRELLVRHLPPVGSLERDRLLDAVFARIATDPAPSVRLASIDALPGGLPAALEANLLSALRQDAEPEVRERIALYLREAPSPRVETVQALLASARDAGETPAVRRASIVALLSLDRGAPGLLEAAGSSEVALRAMRGAISAAADRG